MTSRLTKINFIKKNVCELSFDDKQHILGFIKDKKYVIKGCNDGSRINLDLMSDNHIYDIYKFINNQLKVPDKYKMV